MALFVCGSLRVAALLPGKAAAWPFVVLYDRASRCWRDLRSLRLAVTDADSEPLTLMQKAPRFSGLFVLCGDERI